MHRAVCAVSACSWRTQELRHRKAPESRLRDCRAPCRHTHSHHTDSLLGCSLLQHALIRWHST